MSRADLDNIQAQLRVAIQNHQVLVARMKNDPQNAGLQKQLHEMQTKITSLSDKQKIIVQQLRKDLVTKKPPSVITTSVTVTATVPAIVSSTTVAVVRPQQGPSAPRDKRPNIVAPSPHRSASPLIRVPQYPSHRPAILSKQQASTSASHSRPKPSSDGGHIRDNKRTTSDSRHVPPSEKKKLEYMAALDLVTPVTCKELQSKRTERKRRSTANPQFAYGHFEERRTGYHYLSNILAPGSKRQRGGSRGNSNHDSYNNSHHTDSSAALKNGEGMIDGCAVCHKEGQLAVCGVCGTMYHPACLDPPLSGVPTHEWICPKCLAMEKQPADLPGTLALVSSYIAHKAAREDEKRRLEKQNQELQGERNQLEFKAKQLNENIVRQCQMKNDLVQQSRGAQQSVDKLKNFIKVFQT